ncbi:hypothetical protein Esti_005233 [Eimeria stiedai]
MGSLGRERLSEAQGEAKDLSFSAQEEESDGSRASSGVGFGPMASASFSNTEVDSLSMELREEQRPLPPTLQATRGAAPSSVPRKQRSGKGVLLRSATIDTEEACAARASFQSWLNRASRWMESSKGHLLPAVDTSERMELWEVAILRGALVSYNLPHLESEAGIVPYDPTRLGFSAQSYAPTGSAGARPFAGKQGKEEEALVKKARDAKAKLRLRQEAVVGWVQEVLQAVAAEAAALSKGPEEETAEELCVRLGRRSAALTACAFYEQLSAFLKCASLPPDGSTLNAYDMYAFKRDLAASNAAAALSGLRRAPTSAEAAKASPAGKKTAPAVLVTDSSAPPVLRAAAAENPFVPPWVVHLFLGRSNQALSAAFRLRLAVQLQGIPFRHISDEALGEYEQLLKSSVELQKGFSAIAAAHAGKEEEEQVRLRRKELLITLMQIEVALASFKIPKLENKIADIHSGPSLDLRKLQKVLKKLLTAYEGLAEKAAEWKDQVEKGKFSLSEEEAKDLKTVLNQLGLLSFFSKRLVTAHAEAAVSQEVAEKYREHIQKTAGLVALAELQISQAARGPLHKGRIVPRWWANIR